MTGPARGERERAIGRATPLGPVGRPWSAARLVAAALAFATLGVAGLVMLSDRAPGLLRRVSERIDATDSTAIQAVGQATPPSDTLVHLVAWGTVMVLVGLATWSWRSLGVAAIAVFALSAATEVAQGSLTLTRNTELSDLAANFVGVLAGLALVVLWSITWSSLARRPVDDQR